MIKVDETKCIGCGACVAIAPENFDFNDAGLSKVVGENVTDSTKEAATSCPVGAISVDEGGEVGTPASLEIDGGEMSVPADLDVNAMEETPAEETTEEQ